MALIKTCCFYLRSVLLQLCLTRSIFESLNVKLTERMKEFVKELARAYEGFQKKQLASVEAKNYHGLRDW